LVPETEAQARALEQRLGDGVRCFIAMRYWHPFTREAVAAVKAWSADRVVLLPLYPQFSTTTTGSSLTEWVAEAGRQGLILPTRTVCCYPTQPGLVEAMADLVRRGHAEALGKGKPRVLFSAHGLPKTVIERGDPYQAQVELTAAAVAAATGIEGLDWAICYQSRVGPMEWIGPSTEAELERAGRDRVPVVVVPVAFVSEHSETLVELDIEYRHRADGLGIPAYVRVPALGCHPAFIAALAEVAGDPDAVKGQACGRLKRGCAC
jgi:ferrochelatase